MVDVIKNTMLNHYELLQELNTTFCIEHGQHMFYDLQKLQHSISNCYLADGTIYYDIPSISIRNQFIPSHTIPNATQKLNHIEISISIKNIGIKNITKNAEDPISQLEEFNIIMSSYCQRDALNFMSSWHLDKRLSSSTYDTLEPEYHFTFGGKKMEESYANNWDFGQALILRAPRLMHPPMDIILGIDFLLNQFISSEYSNDFLQNVKYKKHIKVMKEILWKPYALAVAKNLCSNWENANTFSFDEDFCRAVLGNAKN